METITLRLRIEMLSPFVSPLQSDTLFGHLIWIIRYCEGETAVVKLLKEIYEGKGLLAVSAGFPCGKIPVPLMPLNEEKTNGLLEVFKKACAKVPGSRRPEYYTARYFKAFKKSFGYSDANLFYSDSNIKSLQEIIFKDIVPDIEDAISFVKQPFGYCGPEDKVKKNKRVFVIRNLINRHTGCTGEGSLFHVENEFYEDGYLKDLYVRTNIFEKDNIKKYFDVMGKYGYGADATIGKGCFKVNSLEECEFLNHENAEYMVSLGSCIPDEKEINLKDSFYSVFVKRGKMGAEYAGGAAEKQGSFFKVPLLMLKEGALLNIRLKKQIYGKIENKVNFHIPQAVQSGQCFGPMVKL